MKKPKAPRLVTVAIFTTITIIFWVFFSLYGIFTSKAPVEVDPKLLEPLDPSLDINALTQLEGRVFFEEGYFASPTLIIQPVVTPPPEQPPSETVATESAEELLSE